MKYVQQKFSRSKAEFAYNIPYNFEVDMLEYYTCTVIRVVSGHPEYRESLAGLDIINKLIIKIRKFPLLLKRRHKKFHRGCKYYVCQNNTCHILLER
jgi:hypothetical protein